jgi:hypothetical protein
MSIVSQPPEAPRDLKKDCLSYSGVIAQSISVIAPSTVPAAVLSLIFVSARNGTWLSFLLSTMGLLFVCFNINQFARRSASPGSLSDLWIRSAVAAAPAHGKKKEQLSQEIQSILSDTVLSPSSRKITKQMSRNDVLGQQLLAGLLDASIGRAGGSSALQRSALQPSGLYARA